MGFLYRCFLLHPYAQQECIYSSKNTQKGHFLIQGKKGRGSSTPWALCVHVPDVNQLSKDKRQFIITLRTGGQSVRQIAKTLNVSPSAVANTIKHYDKTSSHEDCPRKGRPRVASAVEDKFNRGTTLRNRKCVCSAKRKGSFNAM